MAIIYYRSTIDSNIGKEIKTLIMIPYFLSPLNHESTLTWIFMGAPGPGASMHVSYESVYALEC